MDRETAAIVANARDLATWAAEAVVQTDALIEIAKRRPLSPQEQAANLQMQRELLVRMSQQHSLLEWAAAERGTSQAWIQQVADEPSAVRRILHFLRGRRR